MTTLPLNQIKCLNSCKPITFKTAFLIVISLHALAYFAVTPVSKTIKATVACGKNIESILQANTIDLSKKVNGVLHYFQFIGHTFDELISKINYKIPNVTFQKASKNIQLKSFVAATKSEKQQTSVPPLKLRSIDTTKELTLKQTSNINFEQQLEEIPETQNHEKFRSDINHHNTLSSNYAKPPSMPRYITHKRVVIIGGVYNPNPNRVLYTKQPTTPNKRILYRTRNTTTR